jgi:hypothetical protein
MVVPPTFYATMVVAGLVVETIIGVLGLVPDERNAKVVEANVAWNYTTVLNIAFLVLTAVLVVRFLRTAGPAMLPMMGNPPRKLTSPAVARNTHASAHLEAGTQDYVCPMHPEVVSNSRSRCPKCGMQLESRASREDR